jgi:hypothetical protein
MKGLAITQLLEIHNDQVSLHVITQVHYISFL